MPMHAHGRDSHQDFGKNHKDTHSLAQLVTDPVSYMLDME